MNTPEHPANIPAGKVESIVSTVLLAFATDPMARWSYPSARDYLNGFPHFIRAFTLPSLTTGGALASDDGHGFALWLPPGVEPDGEAIVAGFKSTMEPRRFEQAMEVVEKMEALHPKEPHWYLPLIAVDPGHGGGGIGTRLMKTALDRCDSDGVGAYLESSNPANTPWYEHLGFRSCGVIQAAGSPAMRSMFRAPQSRAREN